MKTLRRCVVCDKEFEANGTQTTCLGPHYRKCVVCGNDFEFRYLWDKRQTCSRECWTALRKINISNKDKVCQYCGKSFRSESNTAKYCAGPHYSSCVICGNMFEFNIDGLQVPEGIPKTCSKECTRQLVVKTNMERYGFTTPSQMPEARHHARLQSIANREKREQTCLNRYGVRNVGMIPEVKAAISKKIASEANQLRMRATMQDRYGVNYAMQNAALARKQAVSRFNQQSSDGTQMDSSWELDVYEFCLRANLPFVYNEKTIPYTYDGRDHLTYIDFVIEDILVEVKGSHIINDSYYDNQPGSTPIGVKLNVYNANNVVIVSDKGFQDIFNELGLDNISVVDVRLFRKTSRDTIAITYYKYIPNDEMLWHYIVKCLHNKLPFISYKEIIQSMNEEEL